MRRRKYERAVLLDLSDVEIRLISVEDESVRSIERSEEVIRLMSAWVLRTGQRGRPVQAKKKESAD